MSASDAAWNHFASSEGGGADNSRIPYTADYGAVFETRDLAYTRRAGPIPGSRKWTDKRYVHPAGYNSSRADSYRGLA
jgi:hypothetical protein